MEEVKTLVPDQDIFVETVEVIDTLLNQEAAIEV